MEYTVEITINAIYPLSQDDLFEVAEIGGAASGTVGKQRLHTVLTVDAPSAYKAIDIGLRKVIDKVDGVVVATSAMTTDEADRIEAAHAALVGVGEIAQMLDISKQRVTTLSKREDFPAPLVRLASGPVWRRGDLSTFAEGWQRKGGRPRKEVSATAE